MKDKLDLDKKLKELKELGIEIELIKKINITHD
jgi:hypothetical protein